IMPVYNPPIEMLREAIESVKAQVYFNWELCIADDASTDEKVRLFLDQIVQADHRIKVIYREENGHISKASNSALDIADGEFIVLMDNDDALPEHALFWV
ncbi:glycosyltransferase, partial [Pseudomonas viridiflava]|uniref:glycosyltransferase n=1 Tax=Pseudomonas viridiflava TaxID=33069 RepID=UPI000F08E63D